MPFTGVEVILKPLKSSITPQGSICGLRRAPLGLSSSQAAESSKSGVKILSVVLLLHSPRIAVQNINRLKPEPARVLYITHKICKADQAFPLELRIGHALTHSPHTIFSPVNGYLLRIMRKYQQRHRGLIYIVSDKLRLLNETHVFKKLCPSSSELLVPTCSFNERIYRI